MIEQLKPIYEKMLLVRRFEEQVIKAVRSGRITIPVYLSSGQEAVIAAISTLFNHKWQIFTQHRCHDTYLCFGGDPAKLRDELLGLPSGTSHGKAGSNCVHDLSIQMYGHHGLIGENVSLACGAAFANRKPTLCVFGDGAAEEDYVLSSLGFAATHKLPILFVCMDNGLSVLTKKEERRSWDLVDVARGFGLAATNWEFTSDYGFVHNNGIYDFIYYLHQNPEIELPWVCNFEVERLYWHVGVGQDQDDLLYDPLFGIEEDLIGEYSADEYVLTTKDRITKEIEDLWR